MSIAPAPSMPGGSRQTRAYLMQLLQANGLAPRRQLGQNFLIDLNLMDLLVRSAELVPGDIVLEVGAGTGALTCRLAEAGARVISIEKDPGFFRLASFETQGRPEVEILNTDVLAGKNQIAPAVMSALANVMRETGKHYFDLVANLPYDVAAAVIGNLLLESLPIRRMTTTIQLELAERVLAKPGTKDYGPLSVLLQVCGRSTLIRQAPPEAFWPRPKVTSAIVRIDVDEPRGWPREERAAFHKFVRDLFLHRRKGLRWWFRKSAYRGANREILEAFLAANGLPGVTRAEQLEPGQLLALFRMIKGGNSPGPRLRPTPAS